MKISSILPAIYGAGFLPQQSRRKRLPQKIQLAAPPRKADDKKVNAGALVFTAPS
jgi:hypothetical protein